MVLHGRQQVVEERTVDRLAVVETHFFEKRRAETRERGAFVLQIALSWMNRLADVHGGANFQHAKLARFNVDFDFGAGCRVKPERRSFAKAGLRADAAV